MGLARSVAPEPRTAVHAGASAASNFFFCFFFWGGGGGGAAALSRYEACWNLTTDVTDSPVSKQLHVGLHLGRALDFLLMEDLPSLLEGALHLCGCVKRHSCSHSGCSKCGIFDWVLSKMSMAAVEIFTYGATLSSTSCFESYAMMILRSQIDHYLSGRRNSLDTSAFTCQQEPVAGAQKTPTIDDSTAVSTL